jgi:hypothetical protein
VLLLVAIYVFAIGVSARSYPPQGSHVSSSYQQQTSFSAVQSTLYDHTTQADISGYGVNILPIKEFKNQFEKLIAISSAFEFLIETESSQYTKFSINLLINYRKTDLIFPFHYFW